MRLADSGEPRRSFRTSARSRVLLQKIKKKLWHDLVVKFIFETEKSGNSLKRLKVVEIVPANFAEFGTVYDERKLYIVQQLIDLGELQRYQKGWIYHQLKELPELELSLGDWREIARRLGYKAGWGWYKWKEMLS